MQPTRTWPFLFVSLCLTCFLLLLLPAGTARAQTKLSGVLEASGYRWVPLKRPTRNTIAAEVAVNGRRALLVVDSGAPASGLRREWLRRLGLTSTAMDDEVRGAGGSVEKGLRRVEVNNLQVGPVVVGRFPLVISDYVGLHNVQGASYVPTGSFIPVRPEMGERMNVDGFFGADLLTACHAIVDLKNYRLYLKPPAGRADAPLSAGLRGAGLVEIPLEHAASGHRYLVRAEVNGQSGTLLLDTGANLTNLNLREAGRLRLTLEHSNVRSLDVGGRASETRYARLESLRLGDWELRGKGVGLQNISGASGLLGLLGVDVIGTHGGIVDFGQNRLYLERPRG